MHSYSTVTHLIKNEVWQMITTWLKTLSLGIIFEREKQQITSIYNIKCLKMETSYK